MQHQTSMDIHILYCLHSGALHPYTSLFQVDASDISLSPLVHSMERIRLVERTQMSYQQAGRDHSCVNIEP